LVVERAFSKIEGWADRLKNEIRALYLAFRHPKTPLFAKIWVGCVVAYAISPIDLIPDFIPVVGYIDDLILLPAGIWVAIKMIPPEVLAECRSNAVEPIEFSGPLRWVFIPVISVLWIGIILSLGMTFWKQFYHS